MKEKKIIVRLLVYSLNIKSHTKNINSSFVLLISPVYKGDQI